VLVNSRDPSAWFSLDGKNIVLEELTTQESSELFRHLTGKERDFATLSERIGGLPLAITMLARHIITKGLSLKEYLRLYDKVDKEIQSKRYFHRDYRDSLDTFWSDNLNQLSPSSRGMLQVISLLDPEFIQDSILIPSQTMALKEFPQTESDLLDSRSDLLRHALVVRSSGGDGLQVHRLLQTVVRGRMDPNEVRNALLTVVNLVTSAWIDTNSSEQGRQPNPEIRDGLLPHVVRLKNFTTEMMDSEDDICTNTDFVKFRATLKSKLPELFPLRLHLTRES
jgi:hypothetical protein